MAMFNVISLNCNGLCDSNKRNCIFSLCNERFYDIICLQETFWNDLFVERIKRDKTIWDGDIFYSNSGNNRQGVAILVSKKLKNIFLEVENDNGRFIHIKGTINDKLIDIYNIYAPNNVNERYEFFLKCKQKISKGKYVLVAGDFNTTLSSLDKSGKTMHCNDKAVKSLCNFMQEKELYDIWRNRNVNTKVFSRKQVVQGFLTQSRIDYFLVSLDLKSCIKNIHYKDTSFSDHSIVSMKIDFCNVERGPGVWVFNNSFLQDELFIDKMKRLFANEIGSDFYVSNPLIWWDNLKFTIKRLSQIYGKEKQKDLNREYYKLQNKIQELSVKSANGIQINSELFLELQTQLEDIETYKCQGAILRSKSQWALESDRNTAYFLKLEKYRQNKNVISEIKDCDGKIVTETNDLLDVIHDYYKHLFSCVSIDMHSVDELLNNVNVKIDDEDVEMCDDEISIEEIEKSLKGMKKGKTPGPDGITAEFYLYFFNELKHVLLYIYQSIEENEELSRSMRYGNINIIFKNKGDQSDLKNFRPISLLNVDYKILARVMANRFKYVLPKVISPNQSCCILGKDISDTVVSVRDFMDLVEMDDIECYLLKLDQEKAFDRAGHEYLFAVLDKFGFGNKFKKWIKIFYTNIFSSVKCNGFLTPYFRLKNSVKQGCPISALLYVLLAEPLSIAIKKNCEIRGVVIPNTNVEEKVFVHADDTTLTLVDKNSVSETFRVLELYEKASGAKLNKEKSEVLALGKGKICSNDLKIWKIKECDEVLQLLGIWVGKNKTLCEKLNWEGKVQSITKLLNFWKMRHLTLHGRVSVISALLMSKLWYTLMVVNIPEKYCILIKKKCLEFLWNNKPPLVAYEVIINKVVDGGLNFPDIMQKMYAFRLKYLSRLLDENYCAIWKQTCLYFFSKFENMNLGIEILFCDLRNRKIDALPEFYQSLILSWQSICENVDIEVNSENVFDIPLFLNPNITNGNKMLYLKTFIEAGVCKIKDIAYECKPGFLKESYIQEIVLEKFPEVSENKMLHAVRNVLETIPDEYKVLVEANVHVSKTPVLKPMIKDGVQICSLPSTTNFYYRMLVSKLSREPKSVSRWRLMYADFDLRKIQKIMNFSFLQSDCREVAFKVFHRIIFTKERLFKCRITKDSLCPICSTLPENLNHLILECTMLTRFNDFVKNFLHNILYKSSGSYINDLSFEFMCMFGLTKQNKYINYYFVNSVLAIRRFCIVKRRNIAMLENKIIDIEQYFKSTLVKNVNYAYEHYKRNNALQLFEKYYSENNPVLIIRDNQIQIDF